MELEINSYYLLFDLHINVPLHYSLCKFVHKYVLILNVDEIIFFFINETIVRQFYLEVAGIIELLK